MFSFLNLNLSYRRYQNVYFDIICADVVYPAGKSYRYLLIFATIKEFLDVYIMQNILAKRRILKVGVVCLIIHKLS